MEQFDTVFRGYEPKQVDTKVTELQEKTTSLQMQLEAARADNLKLNNSIVDVNAKLSDLGKENQTNLEQVEQLTQENRRLQRSSKAYTSLGDTAQAVIDKANDDAQLIVTKAKTQAEEIRNTANTQAQAVVEQARNTANETVSKAKAEAELTLKQASDHAAETVREADVAAEKTRKDAEAHATQMVAEATAEANRQKQIAQEALAKSNKIREQLTAAFDAFDRKA